MEILTAGEGLGDEEKEEREVGRTTFPQLFHVEKGEKLGKRPGLILLFRQTRLSYVLVRTPYKTFLQTLPVSKEDPAWSEEPVLQLRSREAF